jgi:hypothetical protein
VSNDKEIIGFFGVILAEITATKHCEQGLFFLLFFRACQRKSSLLA